MCTGEAASSVWPGHPATLRAIRGRQQGGKEVARGPCRQSRPLVILSLMTPQRPWGYEGGLGGWRCQMQVEEGERSPHTGTRLHPLWCSWRRGRHVALAGDGLGCLATSVRAGSPVSGCGSSMLFVWLCSVRILRTDGDRGGRDLAPCDTLILGFWPWSEERTRVVVAFCAVGGTLSSWPPGH